MSQDTVSLDFAPHPAAAGARQRIGSTARIETSLLLRNGEQLLLALVIPLAALFVARYAGQRFSMGFATTAPSVWALAVWSTSFSSVAIATGFDRRYGVLERLAATPLGPGGLVIAKVIAALSVIAGQLVILIGTSLALGWRPSSAILVWPLAVVGGAAAIASFTALALALAGTARAELTLALANLIYLAGAALGILVPTASFGPVAWLVRVLPTGALGDLWRTLGTGQTAWWPVLVLLVWAGAAAVLARKVFRWMG